MKTSNVWTLFLVVSSIYMGTANASELFDAGKTAHHEYTIEMCGRQGGTLAGLADVKSFRSEQAKASGGSITAYWFFTVSDADLVVWYNKGWHVLGTDEDLALKFNSQGVFPVTCLMDPKSRIIADTVTPAKSAKKPKGCPAGTQQVGELCQGAGDFGFDIHR